MFQCKCCGECCRDGTKVYLNPDDLVRIAKFLKYKNTKELFTNFFVIIDTKRSNYPLPVMRFSKGVAGCCPFLINRIENDNLLKGICQLHANSKPLVCSLAPLYRSIDFSKNIEKWGFKLPVIGCLGGSIEPENIKPPKEIKHLLDREKDFFKKLSIKLASINNVDEICNEFYYLRVDY